MVDTAGALQVKYSTCPVNAPWRSGLVFAEVRHLGGALALHCYSALPRAPAAAAAEATTKWAPGCRAGAAAAPANVEVVQQNMTAGKGMTAGAVATQSGGRDENQPGGCHRGHRGGVLHGGMYDNPTAPSGTPVSSSSVAPPVFTVRVVDNGPQSLVEIVTRAP